MVSEQLDLTVYTMNSVGWFAVLVPASKPQIKTKLKSNAAPSPDDLLDLVTF